MVNSKHFAAAICYTITNHLVLGIKGKKENESLTLTIHCYADFKCTREQTKKEGNTHVCVIRYRCKYNHISHAISLYVRIFTFEYVIFGIP